MCLRNDYPDNLRRIIPCLQNNHLNSPLCVLFSQRIKVVRTTNCGAYKYSDALLFTAFSNESVLFPFGLFIRYFILFCVHCISRFDFVFV
jgi:hypothetical protein